MFVPCYTGQFRKDLRRLEKSGNKDTGKLKAVLNLLIEGKPLSARHRDHTLTGNYQNRRECHIEPDWLLIYKIDKGDDKCLLQLINEEASTSLQ